MYCCMYSTGVLYEGMEGGEALPLHLYYRGRVVGSATSS